MTPDLSNWSNRKKITIDSSKVDDNLSDFPVVIHLDTDTDLADGAQDSGNDILFIASDEQTQLSHEIESFDSSTGTLWAHVKIPSLTASSDTTIYIYYGNSESPNQESVADVWSNNFIAVYHLTESGGGTGNSEVYKDSSANSLNGDDYVSASSKDGKIASGQVFNGNGDYIELPNDTAFSPNRATVSAWAKFGGEKGKEYILDGRGHQYWIKEDDGTEKPSLGFRTTDNQTLQSIHTENLSGFHYVAGTFDGSGAQLYVDGVTSTFTAGSGDVATSSGASIIGDYVGSGYTYDGAIDEARWSSVARSDAWISTTYANQDEPLSFYAVDSEESLTSSNESLTGSNSSGLVLGEFQLGGERLAEPPQTIAQGSVVTADSTEVGTGKSILRFDAQPEDVSSSIVGTGISRQIDGALVSLASSIFTDNVTSSDVFGDKTTAITNPLTDQLARQFDGSVVDTAVGVLTDSVSKQFDGSIATATTDTKILESQTSSVVEDNLVQSLSTITFDDFVSRQFDGNIITFTANIFEDKVTASAFPDSIVPTIVSAPLIDQFARQFDGSIHTATTNFAPTDGSTVSSDIDNLIQSTVAITSDDFVSRQFDGVVVDAVSNGFPTQGAIATAANTEPITSFTSITTEFTDSNFPNDARVYYPLNSVSDGIAEDESGNDFDATVEAGISETSGIANNAADFDSSGSIISNSEVQFVTNDLNDIFAISVWVNATSNDNYDQPVSFDNNTGIFTTSAGNWGVQSSGDNSGVDTHGAPTIKDGEWHHLVGIYIEGERYIGYQDGVEIFNETTSDTAGLGSGITIGGTQQGSDAFVGAIDEVRVFDRVLTSDEVQSLYNNPAGVSASPVFTRQFDGSAPVVSASVKDERIGSLTLSDNTIAAQEQGIFVDEFSQSIDGDIILANAIQKFTDVFSAASSIADKIDIVANIFEEVFSSTTDTVDVESIASNILTDEFTRTLDGAILSSETSPIFNESPTSGSSVVDVPLTTTEVLTDSFTRQFDGNIQTASTSLFGNASTLALDIPDIRTAVSTVQTDEFSSTVSDGDKTSAITAPLADQLARQFDGVVIESASTVNDTQIGSLTSARNPLLSNATTIGTGVSRQFDGSISTVSSDVITDQLARTFDNDNLLASSANVFGQSSTLTRFSAEPTDVISAPLVDQFARQFDGSIHTAGSISQADNSFTRGISTLDNVFTEIVFGIKNYPNDPVAYYSLDSVADGIAEDSSGNGHDGIIRNEVSSTVGIANNAASFDSDEAEIEIQYNASSEVIFENWTIAGWINLSDWSSSTRKEWASISEDVSDDKPLDFLHEEGKIKHYRGELGGEVLSHPVDSLSGWHHMTVTQERQDSSTVNIKMYLDGSVVDSDSGDYENMRPSFRFTLGNIVDGRFDWIDKLDEVRLYDRTLSNTEVSLLFENPINQLSIEAIARQFDGSIAQYDSITLFEQTVTSASSIADKISATTNFLIDVFSVGSSIVDNPLGVSEIQTDSFTTSRDGSLAQYESIFDIQNADTAGSSEVSVPLNTVATLGNGLSRQFDGSIPLTSTDVFGDQFTAGIDAQNITTADSEFVGNTLTFGSSVGNIPLGNVLSVGDEIGRVFDGDFVSANTEFIEPRFSSLTASPGTVQYGTRSNARLGTFSLGERQLADRFFLFDDAFTTGISRNVPILLATFNSVEAFSINFLTVEPVVVESQVLTDEFAKTLSEATLALVNTDILGEEISRTFDGEIVLANLQPFSAIRYLRDWTFGDVVGTTIDETRTWDLLELTIRYSGQDKIELVSDITSKSGKGNLIEDPAGGFKTVDTGTENRINFRAPTDREELRSVDFWYVNDYSKELVDRGGDVYDIELELLPEQEKAFDNEYATFDSEPTESQQTALWYFEFEFGDIATNRVSVSSEEVADGTSDIIEINMILSKQEARIIEENASYLNTVKLRTVPDGVDVLDDTSQDNRQTVDIAPPNNADEPIPADTYVIREWETEWQGGAYNMTLEVGRE